MRSSGGDAFALPDSTVKLVEDQGSRETRPNSSSAGCSKSFHGHEFTAGADSG